MDWLNAAAVMVFWSFGFLLLWRIPLPRSTGRLSVRAPTVSVIIPARNEARNIAGVIASLAEQEPRCAEIIVVDDHSTDDTGQIAGEAKATVVTLTDEIPATWQGKPWACWQGASHARGEVLLFLDADTRVEPGGLARIIDTYLQWGGLVSIQPYHHMERLYERLAAFFNVVGMAGINAFTILGHRLRPIGGFGPCNVCSRQDYLEVGGHVRAKGAILESLPLGQAFLSSGRPVHCLGGRGTLSHRMYPGGLRSLVEGFGKGFALGAQAMPLLGLLITICWICGGMDATRHLLRSGWNWSGQASLGWLVVYLLYGLQLHWMLRRIGTFGWSTAFLFPVPLVFFVLVFSWSLVATFVLKRVNWKGRRIEMPASRRNGE